MSNFFDIDLLKQVSATIVGVFVALFAGYLLDRWINKRKITKILKLLSEEAIVNGQNLKNLSDYIKEAVSFLENSQSNDFTPFYTYLYTFNTLIKKNIFGIITQQNLFFYINNETLNNIYAAYNRIDDIKAITDSFHMLGDYTQAERDGVSRGVIEKVGKENIMALLKSSGYIAKEAQGYNEKLIKFNKNMKKFNSVILIVIIIFIGIIGGIYYYLSVTNIPKSDNPSINQGNQSAPEITIKEPNQNELVKTEENIRNSMASSSLTLQYISTQKNPSNFTIGKTTIIGDGAIRMDTPAEWNRPVYIIQQKEYINERCEIYEYEVNTKTDQIVEVHVRYPEEIQNKLSDASGLKALECEKYGSMEMPLKSKAEIEKMAMDFLARNVSNFEQIKSQFVYSSSKKGAENPAVNEWKWEDKSYKLPEGLSGDPSPYPTIRIIVSSGGKLVYYFNSLELFDN